MSLNVHLALATAHSNSRICSVTRLIDMGAGP
jgi:type II secretory ATPase GspE/PulE/Tfp pilus assembly ATPase PilB-like protein